MKAILFASLVVAIVLSCSSCASSPPTHESKELDHLTVAFGPSVNENTNPKMGAIGYEHVSGNLSLRAHAGWIFSDPWNPFVAAVVSLRVETAAGAYMRTGLGPAWFHHVDNRLSSRWEFNISTAIGLVDVGGAAVGLQHDHFSNAGLVPPNLGSDHVSLVVEVPI
jgi:hypothetical protein